MPGSTLCPASGLAHLWAASASRFHQGPGEPWVRCTWPPCPLKAGVCPGSSLCLSPAAAEVTSSLFKLH